MRYRSVPAIAVPVTEWVTVVSVEDSSVCVMVNCPASNPFSSALESLAAILTVALSLSVIVTACRSCIVTHLDHSDDLRVATGRVQGNDVATAFHSLQLSRCQQYPHPHQVLVYLLRNTIAAAINSEIRAIGGRPTSPCNSLSYPSKTDSIT